MARKKSLLSKVAGGAAKYSWLGVTTLAKAGWAGAKLGFKGASWAVKKGTQAVDNSVRVTRSSSQKPEFSSLEEVENQAGSIGLFQDFVYENKSSIGIILGARGSGKSVLGMRLLENAGSKGRKTAAVGFNESSLPSCIKVVSPTDLNAVENGSFLLVDEGGISFSSRNSMSEANKFLSSLLFISRHKDLSVLFISQNSANLEVNTLRQADYLLLKKPSLLQQDFERKKINEIYDKARAGFQKHSDLGKNVFFVYSDAFSGFASNVLPSFWSEKASKAFAEKKL